MSEEVEDLTTPEAPTTPKASMPDLGDFDVIAASEKGARLQLEHPATGDLLDGVYIDLLGSDSKVYRDTIKQNLNIRLNSKKERKVDIDVDAANSLKLLAKMTKGWGGFVVDGSELEFTYRNAITLYTRFPWVKEQAEAFVMERANFLAE